MAESTGVTIVAVLTAGVAGPAITAWATTRGQRRRFTHERNLHDRDDLRDRLDDVAEVLDELERITRIEQERLGAGLDLSNTIDEAKVDFARANRAIARLGLRVGSDSQAFKEADSAAKTFLHVQNEVRLQLLPSTDRENFDEEALEKRHTRGKEAVDRFLRAGRERLEEDDSEEK